MFLSDTFLCFFFLMKYAIGESYNVSTVSIPMIHSESEGIKLSFKKKRQELCVKTNVKTLSFCLLSPDIMVNCLSAVFSKGYKSLSFPSPLVYRFVRNTFCFLWNNSISFSLFFFFLNYSCSLTHYTFNYYAYK